MARNRSAFTLIELLVVIAVILVLAGILFPIITSSFGSATSTTCVNQLKQIGEAFESYKANFHMMSHKAPNWGLWEKPLGTVLEPGNTDAYWGVAYAPYLGNEREVYRCTSAQKMWAGAGYTDWENQPQCTYGLNGYASNKLIPTAFPSASQSVLAQDAYEHLLDGNGDMLCTRPGDSSNLTQWRNTSGAVYEYFRHKNKCNTVFVDGHVEPIPECTDYPLRAYTGK